MRHEGSSKNSGVNDEDDVKYSDLEYGWDCVNLFEREKWEVSLNISLLVNWIDPENDFVAGKCDDWLNLFE